MLNSIQHNAAQFADSIALKNDEMALSYSDLNSLIAQISTQILSQTANNPIAINIDNHPAWVVLDLAALACEAALVPLPSFFSDAQLLHAMQNAGVTAIITDNPSRFSANFG